MSLHILQLPLYIWLIPSVPLRLYSNVNYSTKISLPLSPPNPPDPAKKFCIRTLSIARDTNVPYHLKPEKGLLLAGGAEKGRVD